MTPRLYLCSLLLFLIACGSSPATPAKPSPSKSSAIPIPSSFSLSLVRSRMKRICPGVEVVALDSAPLTRAHVPGTNLPDCAIIIVSVPPEESSGASDIAYGVVGNDADGASVFLYWYCAFRLRPGVYADDIPDAMVALRICPIASPSARGSKPHSEPLPVVTAVQLSEQALVPRSQESIPR